MDNKIKYIIEGFVEVISLLLVALILHFLPVTLNSSLFKLPTLVNVKPSMIRLTYMIYAISDVAAIVAIAKLFDKSIKRSKALSIKVVGWIIALIVIIFIFNNPLFNNLEVIPEVVIWFVVVCIGNVIGYYKNKRRSNKG